MNRIIGIPGLLESHDLSESFNPVHSHWYYTQFINPLILAGCHVRASAEELAVHGALIPCVCVSLCVCLSVCPVSNSFFITPRIGTKFVSVDRVSTR